MELLYADDLVLMAGSDESFNKKVEEVEKRWKQSVLKGMLFESSYNMLIFQVLLTLSYFTLNLPGIDLDLHRSHKINILIAIREPIHDFLFNLY